MKQLTMRLDENHQRPVVKLDNGLTALLDTGAYIPIWTDDEDIIVSKMGAKLVRKDVPIAGFGGLTCGNMYKVTLGVGGILYPDLHIVANNELNTSFNMIISATMFDGLIYQIDTVNHILNIDIPDQESSVRNIRVVDKDGRLHVLCDGLGDSI